MEDNIYFIWEDNETINSAQNNLFISVTTNNGASFQTQNLSALENIPSGTFVGRSIIQEIGDNVYVVWTEGTQDNLDLFIATSNDNGETFTTQNLSQLAGIPHGTSVQSDDGDFDDFYTCI